MNNKLPEFSAAIFDLDGTIADSNSVWERLDKVILERRGINADDDFLVKLAAMTYEQAAAAIRSLGAEISDEEFTNEINALAGIEYAENIKLKPYAAELLREIKKSGKRIVLATASPAEFYEPLLKRTSVYDLFDGFITTDEVGKNKDEPDIYIKAAEIAGCPLSECIIFEDTLTAVRTAAQTNAYVCAVYDKYSEHNADELKKISDKYVYSLNELL